MATRQIIRAVVGTGTTLLGILTCLLVSLFRILRQDSAELRQEMRVRIDSLNSGIDNLYQALFNHKDPAT